MRLSWSSAATRFSTSSAVLPRMSARSLPTSVRMSWSICRIWISRLGDLALRLGDRGDQLSALAFEARLLALQRGDAVELHQLLAPQVADALQLLLDPFDLLVLGGDLRDQAADLLLRLGDALGELRLQAFARLAPRSRTACVSPLIRRATSGSSLRASRSGGKVDLVLAVALGFLARAARRKLVEPLDDDREVGAGLGVVEPDDDVAGLDLIAVAHPQLGDDAAGRVLHLLDVGVDDELALRDHGAGEFAGRGPAADAADQDHHDHEADQEMPPDRLLRSS